MSTNVDGDVSGEQVDWAGLRAAAREVMAGAYVPYSHYPVGAAALTEDGRMVAGCNVENASYGLTLCAECGLVSALHATGGGRLVAFTCCDGQGALLMPCGRCRQLLWEHGGPRLLVDTPRGVLPMTEVLPDAFGPDHLIDYRTRPEPGAEPGAEPGTGTGSETEGEMP